MDATSKQKKQMRLFRASIYGAAALLAIGIFACLLPGWQPSGYRVTPAVCPPGETDSRGYCMIFRRDDYAYRSVSVKSTPMFIHISRGSGPNARDTITHTLFLPGRIVTLSFHAEDPYPPQNRVDAFVQAVRDRRTELYSGMGWPDPNPPAFPPLNR